MVVPLMTRTPDVSHFIIRAVSHHVSNKPSKHSTLTRKLMMSLSVKFILAAIPACAGMQWTPDLTTWVYTSRETKLYQQNCMAV